MDVPAEDTCLAGLKGNVGVNISRDNIKVSSKICRSHMHAGEANAGADLPRFDGRGTRYPARDLSRWRSFLLGLDGSFLALPLRGRRSVLPSDGPRRRAGWFTHWQSVSKWLDHMGLYNTAVVVIVRTLTCAGSLHVLQVDPRGVGRKVRILVIGLGAVGREVDLGVLLLPQLLQLKQQSKARLCRKHRYKRCRKRK